MSMSACYHLAYKLRWQALMTSKRSLEYPHMEIILFNLAQLHFSTIEKRIIQNCLPKAGRVGTFRTVRASNSCTVIGGQFDSSEPGTERSFTGSSIFVVIRSSDSLTAASWIWRINKWWTLNVTEIRRFFLDAIIVQVQTMK